jgi:hypothetical protein
MALVNLGVATPVLPCPQQTCLGQQTPRRSCLPCPRTQLPVTISLCMTVTGRLVRSRAGHAEHRRDPLDGLCLCRAHCLPVLRVGGGDLTDQGEDEVPVVIAFLGGRLTLQKRHGVAEVAEPVFGGALGLVTESRARGICVWLVQVPTHLAQAALASRYPSLWMLPRHGISLICTQQPVSSEDSGPAPNGGLASGVGHVL